MAEKKPLSTSVLGSPFDTPEIYRVLIENIQDGVFIIQEARMGLVNQAFADMTGYSVEQIVGKHFTELVAPEDVEMVKERYWKRSLQQPEVPKQYEFGRRCFELIGRQKQCDRCATSEVYKTKRPAQVERYEGD